MAIVRCMNCYSKTKVDMSGSTTEARCPICQGILVGPNSPGGRRLRAIFISQAIRDALVIIAVVLLAMANAKYTVEEFAGSTAQRIFSPFTPGVLMCLLLTWLQRYACRLYCMIIGQRVLYGDIRDPSLLKRFAYIGGSIAALVLACVAYKHNIWPFVAVGNFVKSFLASDVAVGTALMMFLVQKDFSDSEDYMSKVRWIRERPSDWCTGLPLPLEIFQCYTLCILLTLSGLLIACGPDWFSGTAFGEAVGIVRNFFVSFYGLFGVLVKMVLKLIIGIIGFVISFFV